MKSAGYALESAFEKVQWKILEEEIFGDMPVREYGDITGPKVFDPIWQN